SPHPLRKSQEPSPSAADGKLHGRGQHRKAQKAAKTATENTPCNGKPAKESSGTCESTHRAPLLSLVHSQGAKIPGSKAACGQKGVRTDPRVVTTRRGRR